MTTGTNTMIPISERNRQILEMRKQRVSRREVARRSNLSTTRILQLEKRDAAERFMAKRRAELQEEIRRVHGMEKNTVS